MKIIKAEVTLNSNDVLGESPLWHPYLRKLFWVDIEKRQLHAWSPSTNIHSKWFVKKRIGAVVPAKNGSLILALQGEIAEINLQTNKIRHLINLDSNLPHNRCNDGKCDALGRFWIGTMDINCKPGQGSLYCIDSKLKPVRILDNLTIPNGMDWSVSNNEMYFIDSHERNVKCFEFYRHQIITSTSTIVIESGVHELPDGMCVDNEGMLWVAIWGGRRVARYDPKTGLQLAEVEVPALHVTSCCFGDEDLKTLYITTARQGLSKMQLEEYPLSGSIFSCRPGAMGITTNFFSLLT